MIVQFSPRFSSSIGMFGAALFFAGLLIEYHYGLFPPGSGTLYTLNQLQFFMAMTCILALLWAVRAERAGGNGRFARISLSLFPIGWGLIILGGVIDLLTGSADSPLIPLGALTMVIFGLMAGIVVAVAHKWSSWRRYVLLLQGVYYALLVLRAVITSQGPTLLTESVWMAIWFLVGLALWQESRSEVKSSTSSEELNF
ncbi:MAG: hypothetical protein R6X34_03110 [Chloroflexota bacterium]